MSYSEIIALAYALSIDAFVVSFCYGLAFTRNRLYNALLLAFCTAIFQGIMPVLGYFTADFIKTFIEPFSKWIIFGIFVYLGIKFICESFVQKCDKNFSLDIKNLLLIGIATSIDAFSAGITLLLSGNGILKPALFIAFVTFANSLCAFFLGGKLKRLPTRLLEILAGILLILLGVKAII